MQMLDIEVYWTDGNCITFAVTLTLPEIEC